MNPIAAESEFRAGIKKLLDDIDNQFKHGYANTDAYGRDEVFHERDTRIFFFDRLLQLLGWNLGMGGNVAQEARIKAGTTKFVDYVGINQDTRAPILILEAKAWDKPIIAGKGEMHDWSKVNLIIDAVRHVNEGGSRGDSPVTSEWYDHISQLAGYIRGFSDQYGHSVSRAVLSSGQWLLVFAEPVSTFSCSQIDDQQIYLFERDGYVKNAHIIFRLLARVKIADSVPFPIRSSQLRNYVSKEKFIAAYHGVLIHYEASGTPVFAQRPRILIYPTLIIQRDDNALITVIDAEEPIPMQISQAGNGVKTLKPHLDSVSNAADKLLQRCSDELALPLKPSELADFPGFSTESILDPGGLALDGPQKLLVKPIRTATNNWLAVTGSQTHYLHELPTITCKFHAWAQCKAVHQSIGANAVNSPSTKSPRAFFVDGQPHHCAHQTIIDRREVRCYIKALDARTCCNACVCHGTCWPPMESAELPCGS